MRYGQYPIDQSKEYSLACYDDIRKYEPDFEDNYASLDGNTLNSRLGKYISNLIKSLSFKSGEPWGFSEKDEDFCGVSSDLSMLCDAGENNFQPDFETTLPLGGSVYVRQYYSYNVKYPLKQITNNFLQTLDILYD